MNEDKKEQPKTVVEKVKRISPRKKARASVVGVFVVLLVFATISNVGFKGFDFKQWLVNVLMLICIIVFGLLIGESGGEDKYKEDPKEIFQVNLKRYRLDNLELRNRFNYFPQWYRQFLPKQLYEKKMLFLIAEDIEPDKAELLIKYATQRDLSTLFTEPATKVVDPITKEEHFILQIREEQRLAVETLLNGEIKLDYNNSNYFLEEFADADDNVVLAEQGKHLKRQITKNKKINRATKIAFTVVGSALWSALTVYELMTGDSLQTWLNLISRITALCTSLLSGFLSAKVTVKLEARILLNKSIVLETFKDDLAKNNFTAKTDEEIAREVYKEEERKKEEAKKNVIDPLKDSDKVEVIPMKTAQLEMKNTK